MSTNWKRVCLTVVATAVLWPAAASAQVGTYHGVCKARATRRFPPAARRSFSGNRPSCGCTCNSAPKAKRWKTPWPS